MDTEALKSSLAGVAKASTEADGAGKSIKAAAEERLAVVTAALDDLRPKAMTDMTAANEYLDLVEESGRLNTVIAGG